MIDKGTFEYFSKYIRLLIEKGERIDGRKLDEYRKINIIPSYVKNAEGSCYVELGNTKVIAGVKLEVGEPFPDMPDEGIFIVSLEYLPSSFPTVEPGPPSPEAIEIARIIDRTIRHSNFIDTKKLVIEEGKWVWEIFIDIYVLNDDGNVVDAASIAAAGALLDARFPEIQKVNEEYRVNPKVKKEKLPLNVQNIPLTVTCARVDNKWFVDPNKHEEECADTIFHIGLAEKLVSLQKRKGTIKFEEIDYILQLATRHYKKIKNILLKVIK